jgi:Ca2+-binding RTX toxin-like protein
VNLGSYVLWTGAVPYTWPYSNHIGPPYPGGYGGYTALAAKVKNWHPWATIPARVFWTCAPHESSTSSRASARLEAGDGGDDDLQGDEGDNALAGLGGDDRLSGGAGDDHLHGGGGEDALLGGADDDLIHGRLHDDEAVGGSGSDDLLTGAGHDVARGGSGGDQLFDDEGRDRLLGGPGNDRFSAHDGDRDVIRCGGGEDIALIDRFDEVTGCEHAYRSEREAPERLPEI